MLRAALADVNSRRFFGAHAQSCLGSGLAYVALPLLAYDRFGSAWAVVAVLLPDLLPAVVLGPLVGALVDRWGWRTCALLGDGIRCLAFLVLLFGSGLGLMIGGAALAGVGTALFAPAALAGLAAARAGRPAARRRWGCSARSTTSGSRSARRWPPRCCSSSRPTALLAINAVSFAVSGAADRRDPVGRGAGSVEPGPVAVRRGARRHPRARRPPRGARAARLLDRRGAVHRHDERRRGRPRARGARHRRLRPGRCS